MLELDPTRLLPKIRLIDLCDSLEMHDEVMRICALMQIENSENLGAALMKRGVFMRMLVMLKKPERTIKIC